MNGPLTDQLVRCACCPRRCGVNRLAGRLGFCRVPAAIQVCLADLHFGEEPPISGTRGSGTIFFAGCNLACVFCQNYQISQEFQHHPCRILDVDGLASEMLRLQEQGAHNINFVSPSHMVLQMADAIQTAKRRGLSIPVVYNTNGYDSLEALRQIRGLVDIYLPDIKYMDDALGMRLSGVPDYGAVIPGVLQEMLAQVGHLETDDAGIAVRGLLVRHLVLPGCGENSKRCLEFLRLLSRHTCISIMSQYSPRYKAGDYPGINRSLTPDEYDRVTEYALDLGLENVFVQELASHDHYLPDFSREKPFDPAALFREPGIP
jgi:putative pyruvate formate lyase activating enzyme